MKSEHIDKKTEYFSLPSNYGVESKCDKCGGKLSFEGACCGDGTQVKGLKGWFCDVCDGGRHEER